MNKYVVSLCHTQHSTGEVIIEARDKAHAEQLANELTAGDIPGFDPQDGDLYVSAVAKATKADIQQHAEADERERKETALCDAAPDLLAACKALRDHWSDNLTEPMKLINAAIAKAEGGE